MTIVTGQTTTTMEPTAPTTVKLRDSCHACASSKFRCSKEKPTCARCAKRGRACQYFATRRAGRKQATKVNHQPLMSGLPILIPSPTGRYPNQQDATLTPPPPNHAQICSTYLDPIPSPTCSTSVLDAESGSEKLVFDFEDYFSSPMDICIPPASIDSSSRVEYDLSSWGLSCPLDLCSTWTQPPNEAAFLVDVDDIQSMHTITTRRESDLESQPSTLAEFNIPELQLQRPQNQQPVNGSSCNCLIQILGLLNQLFHAPAPGSSRSSRTTTANQTVSSTPGSSPSSLPSMTSSFADSEHAIESIITMLSCPCVQDSYILILMSLIIFKALTWYEDAASQSAQMADSPVLANHLDTISRNSSISSTTNSKDTHDNTHKSRLTTQSVLGKLHRVQGLINLISQRLKAGSEGQTLQNMDTTLGDDFVAQQKEQHLNGTLPPFSPALLDQMVQNMRKRVRTVSLHLVNALRHL